MVNNALKRQAIFLDRDGVIIRAIIQEGKPHPPSTIGEVEILPGVKEGLAILNRAGFLLIIVSNQPDVARGILQKSFVEQINNSLLNSLPIDDVWVCYHSDQDNCICRKPAPGLLLGAAKKWDIDLEMSYMIGDRWRDILAAKNAGCKSILINNSYTEKQIIADICANSLYDAAQIITEQGNDYESHR